MFHQEWLDIPPCAIQLYLIAHWLKMQSFAPTTPNSLSIPLPPPPHQQPQVFSPRPWVCFLSVYGFMLCRILQYRWKRYNIICVSFSDLLPLVWESVVPTMLLQMAFSSLYGCVAVHCVYTLPSSYLSSVVVHLGRFHIWATVNRAAVNIWMHASFSMKILSRYMPRRGMLDHMVIPYLLIWGTSILFSIVAVTIFIPNNTLGDFPLLHTLSDICYL